MKPPTCRERAPSTEAAAPWYLGDRNKIRAANRHDISEGGRWLTELVALLPELRLVIAMGAAARVAFARWLLTDDARLIPWLTVPHPSQRVLNIDKDADRQLQAAFRIAAKVAATP